MVAGNKRGIFENSELWSSIDTFGTADTNDINYKGLIMAQANEKNKCKKLPELGYYQPAE